MTKNKIIIGIIILIIIAGAGFILQNKFAPNQLNNNQTSEGSEKTKIKIARNPVSLTAFTLFAAQEKGFFTQNGLEVQFEDIQAGISTQALLSKEVDYISVVKEATTASQKGAAIKTIMTYSKNPCLALSGRPGLKINNIKKIVVSSLLTVPHYQALKFINDNKLSAEIIASGENPGAASALLIKKQADAVVQSIVAALRLRDQGYTILKTFDDEIPQGLATTDDKIKNNPEEIQKVIKSIQSALQVIQNNPEETKGMLLKFSNMEKTEANQKIVEEVYPIIKQAFLTENIPSQEGIDILVKLGKAGAFKTFQDVAKQTVNDEDIAKSFDFKFVKNNE